MKKVLFPILGLILAVGLVLPAAAHTEGDPFVTNLIAGGGNPKSEVDVGEVQVWNDGTNLYVKYVVDAAGWVLTETHLAITKSLSGIPQTKTNNPIPGKFPYSAEYDVADVITTDTYTIALGDLSVEPCEDVCIAAHAKVVKQMTMTVMSDTDTMVTYGNFSTPHNAVYAWEPGPSYPNDGPDDSGWEQNSKWDGAIDHTFSASTDWIWESYRVQNPVAGDVVDFEKAFSIPGNPTASTLHITCDNGYEVDVNGTIVGSAQVHGAWRTSDLTESFVNSQEWQSVESWDISGLLVPGQNTLEIDTANEQLNNGTISSNPAGLIFEAEITSVQEETAWGDGERFTTRGNWAMYFTYHVQEPCTSGSVVNGDFETPVVTASQKWDIFDSGTAGLGWTVEWHTNVPGAWGGWTRPDPAHLELHRGVLGAAYEGEQYAELDTDWNDHVGTLNNEPASVKIYQDIDTCPNKTYTLIYAWRLRPDYSDNELEVYWDGSLVATHSGSGGSNTSWTLETETGLSPAVTTTRLAFIETGTADSLGMFLDAVSVVEE